MPARKPSTSSLREAGASRPMRALRSGGCASLEREPASSASTSEKTKTPREVVTSPDRSDARRRRGRRREPGGRVGQHLAVSDAERLDPPLLAHYPTLLPPKRRSQRGMTSLL